MFLWFLLDTARLYEGAQLGTYCCARSLFYWNEPAKLNEKLTGAESFKNDCPQFAFGIFFIRFQTNSSYTSFYKTQFKKILLKKSICF